MRANRTTTVAEQDGSGSQESHALHDLVHDGNGSADRELGRADEIFGCGLEDGAEKLLLRQRVVGQDLDGSEFLRRERLRSIRGRVSVDDGDADGAAFEEGELLLRGGVGADVQSGVGIPDAGRVVVEAEVPPRSEIDQVAVLGVRAG
jgi:hypothetical protein